MIPELEKASHILRIFEAILPSLVWKDVEPKSDQGLESVMARYDCRFYQGTSNQGTRMHPWFVTLTVYKVPLEEAVSPSDDRSRYDGAVAVDGSIVRLTFELAKRAAEMAEEAVG